MPKSKERVQVKNIVERIDVDSIPVGYQSAPLSLGNLMTTLTHYFPTLILNPDYYFKNMLWEVKNTTTHDYKKDIKIADMDELLGYVNSFRYDTDTNSFLHQGMITAYELVDTETQAVSKIIPMNDLEMSLLGRGGYNSSRRNSARETQLPSFPNIMSDLYQTFFSLNVLPAFFNTEKGKNNLWLLRNKQNRFTSFDFKNHKTKIFFNYQYMQRAEFQISNIFANTITTPVSVFNPDVVGSFLMVSKTNYSKITQYISDTQVKVANAGYFNVGDTAKIYYGRTVYSINDDTLTGVYEDEWQVDDMAFVMYDREANSYQIYYNMNSLQKKEFIHDMNNFTGKSVCAFYVVRGVTNPNHVAIFCKAIGVDQIMLEYIDFSAYSLEVILFNPLTQQFRVKEVHEDNYDSILQDVYGQKITYRIGSLIRSSLRKIGIIKYSENIENTEVYLRLRNKATGRVSKLSTSKIVFERNANKGAIPFRAIVKTNIH